MRKMGKILQHPQSQSTKTLQYKSFEFSGYPNHFYKTFVSFWLYICVRKRQEKNFSCQQFSVFPLYSPQPNSVIKSWFIGIKIHQCQKEKHCNSHRILPITLTEASWSFRNLTLIELFLFSTLNVHRLAQRKMKAINLLCGTFKSKLNKNHFPSASSSTRLFSWTHSFPLVAFSFFFFVFLRRHLQPTTMIFIIS